jgi:hypothetical protein
MYLSAIIAGGKWLLPFLFKIPKELWIAGALVVGVLYYGHWTAERARAAKDLEYARVQAAEKARQELIIQEATREAGNRALAATKYAKELEDALNQALLQAHGLPDANRVVLPEPVTRKLRRRPY